MTREEKIASLRTTISVLQGILHELELKQQVEEWYKEAEELQKEFPCFNISEEIIRNEDFCEWLVHKASVRDAYLKTRKEVHHGQDHTGQE